MSEDSRKVTRLCQDCLVKAPGGGDPIEDTIEVVFSRISKISRLSFEFISPQLVSSDSSLRFKMRQLSQGSIKLSILNGDIGLPEINISNEDSEVYRFKRGNVKDFIDLARLSEPQDISLPLSAFLYNIDLQNNAPDSGSFWKKKIKIINFDFLGDSSQTRSGVFIEAPVIDFVERINDAEIDELVLIEGVNKSDDAPKFVTEQNWIFLSFQARESALKRYGDSLRCILTLESSQAERVFALNKSKQYIQFWLTDNGQDYISIGIFDGDRLVCSDTIPIVKSVSCKQRSGWLGISDSKSFGESLGLSGSLRRKVIGLNMFGFVNGEVSLKPGYSGALELPATKSIRWMVALKSMPRYLSKKAESGDFHRYGPRDIDEFELFINGVVDYLVEAGVAYLEPWNEANVIHEWKDDFETLREMQEVFFKATRGRGIKLLTPSSTTWDFEYVNTLIDCGFQDICDGFAMHGYTYSPQLYDKYIEEVSEISLAVGKQFFITEIGFRAPTYDSYHQSLYLFLFSLEAFFCEHIECCIWFRYKNPRHESLAAYNQNASSGYAMIGNESRYARCMYAAFQLLNNLLHSTKQLRRLRLENGAMYKCLSLVNGAWREICFSYAPDCSHAERPEFKSCKSIIDIFGNSVSESSVNRHELVCAFY